MAGTGAKSRMAATGVDEHKRMDQVELAELRTLLAAERTFLAWVRTGLAAIAGGLAIVKLVPFGNPDHETIAHLIGQALILWGCVDLVIALINYRRSTRYFKLENVGQTPIWVFVLLTIFLVIVGLMVFWLTL